MSGGWVFDTRSMRTLSVYGTDEIGWTLDHAISPDGRFFAHCSHDSIRLGALDARGRLDWTVLPVESDGSVAWHSSGYFLISRHEQVVRLDPRTCAVKVEFELPDDFHLYHGALAIHHPYVAISSSEETRIWDEVQRRFVSRLPVAAWAGESIGFSVDGERFSVTNGGGLHVFSVSTWEAVYGSRGAYMCHNHAWAPDGSVLVVPAEGAFAGIHVYDSRSFGVREIVERSAPSLSGIAMGDRLVYGWTHRGDLIAIDIETGELQWRVSLALSCRNADFRGATGLSDDLLEQLRRGGAHC